MVMLMIAATCSMVLKAEDARVPSRSILSIDAGYAGDGHGGHGFGFFIKSASYIGTTPFYFGFGSISGSFATINEAFFETGLMAGYAGQIGLTGSGFDLFIDLLPFGGRVAMTTMLFRQEAPAVHLGASLAFPAGEDMDATISIAPVLRPYDSSAGEWNFSRSYVMVSLALRFKSYLLVERRSWAEFSEDQEARS
jgi:hypothetical protein